MAIEIWLPIVTDDAVWVAADSNVNHVVRLDAKTNKPDIVVTVQKPCSGLAVSFGSLWVLALWVAQSRTRGREDGRNSGDD